MNFEQAIHPISRVDFLSDYWGRRFLRIPGATGRFADLHSWNDLNAILEQHRLTPPRLKLVQDGRALDPGRYLSPGLGGVARLDTGKLASCLGGGATLIIDAVEELAPRVRDISDAFRDALHAGNYVNLYAGWHSQNGFDLHWDSQDTVIMQLSGRKRWKVFEPTRLHPLQNDIEAPPLPTASPAWDGLLEDGDLLYLPRGWWHVAHPVDEPSLHLTIATVPPNGVDLLSWITARLRRHVEVRRDVPGYDDAAGRAVLMATLRRLLNEAMTDDALVAFCREWEGDSFPRPHIHLPDTPYHQLKLLNTSAVRLSAAHRLSFTSVGANVEFRANGAIYVLPASLVPALGLLTDTRTYSVAELTSVVPDAAGANLRTSLEVLARAGVILIENG